MAKSTWDRHLQIDLAKRSHIRFSDRINAFTDIARPLGVMLQPTFAFSPRVSLA
jgi:hypothetical protein